MNIDLTDYAFITTYPSVRETWIKENKVFVLKKNTLKKVRSRDVAYYADIIFDLSDNLVGLYLIHDGRNNYLPKGCEMEEKVEEPLFKNSFRNGDFSYGYGVFGSPTNEETETFLTLLDIPCVSKYCTCLSF